MRCVAVQNIFMGEVMANTIQVEVAYALPQKQKIVAVEVPENCTVEEAIALSNIAALFPEADLQGADAGIFGKVVSRDQVLRRGDRVEIYRPLIADPKEVRKQRAAKARKKH